MLQVTELDLCQTGKNVPRWSPGPQDREGLAGLRAVHGVDLTVVRLKRKMVIVAHHGPLLGTHLPGGAGGQSPLTQQHLFGHNGRQAAQEMASAIEHQDLVGDRGRELRHTRALTPSPPTKATTASYWFLSPSPPERLLSVSRPGNRTQGPLYRCGQASRRWTQTKSLLSSRVQSFPAQTEQSRNRAQGWARLCAVDNGPSWTLGPLPPWVNCSTRNPQPLHQEQSPHSYRVLVIHL